MVKLSTKYIDNKKQTKINRLFQDTLKGLLPEQNASFLQSLLGLEEYQMLANRLLVIILLLDQRSIGSIASTLGVSKGLVSNIKSGLEMGKYEYVIKKFTTKKFHIDDVEKIIETGLRMGGPLPMAHDGLPGVFKGKHLDYRQKYEKSEKERRVLKKEIQKLLRDF